MKIRQLQSIENWISPDEFKGESSYCYMTENLMTSKYSKYTWLENAVTFQTWSQTSSDWTVASLYYGVLSRMRVTRQWYMYSDFSITKWVIYDRADTELYTNALRVTTAVNTYGIAITENSIDRWVWNNGDYAWVLSSTNSINPIDFTWWTIWWTGTWWTLSLWFDHIPWNTDTLTYTSGTITSWQRYRLDVDVTSRTAWSFSITFGWVSITWITASRSFSFHTTSNTNQFVITPTSDFDWDIYNLSLQATLVTENYNSIALNSSTSHPYLLFDWNFLLIAWWNVINYIDMTTDPWLWWTRLTLNKDQRIVAMTRTGDSVIIYSTDGVSSFQHFRNWFDNTVDRTVFWEDLVINAVVNRWNVDYVCTANTSIARWEDNNLFDKRIWRVAWFGRVELFKNNPYTVSIWSSTEENRKYGRRFNFSAYYNAPQCFSNINGKLYIGDYFNSSLWSVGGRLYEIDEQDRIRVYVKLDWTAVVYTSIVWYSGSMALGIQWNGIQWNTWLWYGSAVLSLHENQNNNRNSTWNFETMPFHGDDYSKNKQLLKIRFWYFLPWATDSIKVYYRTNQTVAYTLMKTINDNTNNYFTIEWSDAWLKFHELQLKFEMNRVSSWVSPRIYFPITIRYNDDEQS